MGMSNEEFKTFEKEALAFLRTLDFTPSGYYPYDYFSDVTGYMKPSPPFKIPIKTMVEIVKSTPATEQIEGFLNLAKASLASRMIIISPKRFDTKTQDQISKLGIEVFDRETILATLKEKEISESTIQKYSELYEIVGAPLFAAALSEIAQQNIPKEMREDVKRLELESWQVFEQAVFSIFHYCFNYTTYKLGEDCLFKHEPEGIVIVGDIKRFALLYECKSAQQSYRMNSDHELRYKDYIRKKIDMIRILHAAKLENFVIIGPSFSGDIGERRERIFRETHVLPVFMPASVLSFLGTWACKLPSDIKRLIDLKPIFRLDEKIVSKATVDQYIKGFEKHRKRW